MSVQGLPLLAVALLRGAELVKECIALNGLAERFPALASQSVVFAGGPLVGESSLRGLPVGLDEVFLFETAECRVDRATRKRGDVHNVEAIFVSGADGLEQEGRGVGQSRVRHGYVGILHRQVLV